MSEFELVTLKTGIKSLRALANMETFHPVTGPQAEANILHVEQQRLLERCAATGKFVIWDVGFGAAANVLAAIEALKNSDTSIEIHSFDRSTAPIEFALKHVDELQYLSPYQTQLRRLISDRQLNLSSQMQWKLHLGDFGSQLTENTNLPAPNAIFYDPYSPASNPEMWTLEHFQLLRRHLKPDTPCLLTNYTRSTAVRVTLLLAGFYVGRGCAVGEKAETTVATNRPELLVNPLDQRWLKTVQISGNAAPLSAQSASQAPISAADFERLKMSAQFC